MSQQTWEAPTEGSICWIEIPGRDIDKLKEFYSQLFPSWKFKPDVYQGEEGGSKVHMYSFDRPEGLTGGIVEMRKDCPPHNQSLGAGFTNYYLVNDVDEATAKVEKLGGKVVLPKRPEGKNGIFANVVDVEGNRFGVYQYIGGDN